ncbi:hypothetical protein I314_02581 [Cryptococcus bacillisporus CA1873]|uniref:Uncharacterized protein n=1 Tax=Cryptococcus bacillisporus CA1873 TaxID=1296111 RepID=A0ABR5BDU6_CRYGA|nr:hypothetical protein I314_02581 [Cryptococcus bacillisporus CA1873]|eukprot:KIR67363.1 hypothetical protein I314_02581 [Cryptococcus gattii CA1873]
MKYTIITPLRSRLRRHCHAHYHRAILCSLVGDATPAALLTTNPLHSSDVYVTSDSFETRAVGSAYPSQGIPNTSASVQGTGPQAGSGLALSCLRPLFYARRIR